MKTKVVASEKRKIGETVFKPISENDAQLIACDFYDVVSIVPMDGDGYAVRSAGGFVACIGTVNHPTLGDCPAILHKTEPLREIQFLQLPNVNNKFPNGRWSLQGVKPLCNELPDPATPFEVVSVTSNSTFSVY